MTIIFTAVKNFTQYQFSAAVILQNEPTNCWHVLGILASFITVTYLEISVG